MEPRTWGPQAWHLLHSIAAGHPERATQAQQQAVVDFYNALAAVLPCRTCGGHLAKHLQRHPPVTDSRASLQRWTWELHNIVNGVLGKGSYPLERHLREFETLRQRPGFARTDRVISSVLVASLGVAAAALVDRAFGEGSWGPAQLAALAFALAPLVYFLPGPGPRPSRLLI